jgi:hypothetical protein
MWQAIVFGFLGGALGANGFPHFARGITKQRYPCQLGNGPVPNFVAGWAALVIAGLLFTSPTSAGILAGPSARPRPESC